MSYNATAQADPNSNSFNFAQPPPNKWTIENLSTTFDNNRIFKFTFTTNKNKLK